MTFYISYDAPFGGSPSVVEYETLEEAQQAYDSYYDFVDGMWTFDEYGNRTTWDGEELIWFEGYGGSWVTQDVIDGYNEDWGEPISDYVFSPTSDYDDDEEIPF